MKTLTPNDVLQPSFHAPFMGSWPTVNHLNSSFTSHTQGNTLERRRGPSAYSKKVMGSDLVALSPMVFCGVVCAVCVVQGGEPLTVIPWLLPPSPPHPKKNYFWFRFPQTPPSSSTVETWVQKDISLTVLLKYACSFYHVAMVTGAAPPTPITPTSVAFVSHILPPGGCSFYTQSGSLICS